MRMLLILPKMCSLKPIEDCPVSTGGADFIHGSTVSPSTSASIAHAQRIRHQKRGIDTSKSVDDLLAKVVDFNFPPPTKSIETEELLAHFRTVMLQLSSQQRQVFILRHRDGMMLSEIAQKLK